MAGWLASAELPGCTLPLFFCCSVLAYNAMHAPCFLAKCKHHWRAYVVCCVLAFSRIGNFCVFYRAQHGKRASLIYSGHFHVNCMQKLVFAEITEIR